MFDDNEYFLRKEVIDRAGFFMIITSKKMDTYKALEIYSDGDAIVFRMEKMMYLGFIQIDILKVKMFISFVALIIRNEIYKSLKPLYLKNRKEYTVPKVLREYERLGVTKLSDKKYYVRYKLTKKQKIY